MPIKPLLQNSRQSLLSDENGNSFGLQNSPIAIESVTGSAITVIDDTVIPENYIYQYLLRTEGPQSALGVDYELNTNSNLTVTGTSTFEYEVPTGSVFGLTRFNIIFLDGGIRPNRFGGVGALTNGCLFRIIDTDGTTLLKDFTNNVPLKRNVEWAALAGVDTIILDAAGDDMLPIRFTVTKAGSSMKMVTGQKIRWVNRDDLSGITTFRIMVQGTIKDA